MDKIGGFPKISKIKIARIILIYLLAGSLWIVITDIILGYMMNHKIEMYESQKGLFYVWITALLLYLLLRRFRLHILHLAYHDAFTDLPNSHIFYDTLQKRLDRKKTFSIIVIQISRFDEIMEAFGRTQSRDFLFIFAERLKSVLQSEEQLFLIDNSTYSIITNSEGVVELLHSIEEKMKKPIFFGGQEISLKIHMGFAHYPLNGIDADNQLNYAYRTLSYAKELGATFILGNPERVEDFKHKLFLENELNKSFETGQLTLHFQPKMSVSTHKITGMEALIRWNHPMLGRISPMEFIPIAEENGHIISMGRWILREACQYARRLQEEYSIYVPVSVNVSIKQLWQNDIVDTIQKVLDYTGLKPEYLILEIIESMTMNPESALKILRQLKKLGVKLSIDDFGTGFSSLAYLKKFPIDELKIDKSFIRDILHEKYDQHIIKTIISMAHDLNMNVVAEGVESQGQFECLKNLKCDMIQGYYVSPPIPYEQLVQYLLMENVYVRG